MTDVALRHAITEEQILEYERHGVVCVRDQFDQSWVDQMLDAALGHMTAPLGPLFVQDDNDDPGKFITGTHMSRFNDKFMQFALNSPAAEIAARFMRLDQVRFFYDQLFIKEPGTLAPTAWHNDLPFWPFDGSHVASVWIACTPVTMETSGLVYLAGSHLWDKLFKPVPATPRENFMLDEAEGYEDCPMFHTEFDNPEYEFLSWDMDPGDCLIHHPLAVHGSGKNASNEQRRVALSLRYFGGDAIWHGPRTAFAVPGTEGDTGKGELFEPGKLPINDDVFPIVWPAA